MNAKYCPTSVFFIFQRKYHQKSPKQQILTFFSSEYILKTDAILDHLPASSYAKFLGSHEHPGALIVLYGLANSFYKKQAFTARGSDSANSTV